MVRELRESVVYSDYNKEVGMIKSNTLGIVCCRRRGRKGRIGSMLGGVGWKRQARLAKFT